MENSENLRVILVIDDSECGRVAVERFVSMVKRGLKADAFIVFGVDVKIYPLTSYKKEMKIYTNLRTRASNFVGFYRDRLEDAGVNVRQVKIIFGDFLDEILKLEGIVNPDLIIMGVRKTSIFKKLLPNSQEKLIFKTKSPVLVCKAYEEEVELRRTRCEKCELVEIQNLSS